MQVEWHGQKVQSWGLWISLFNGSSAVTIRLNAMHSGCLALGGLDWMVKNPVQITRSRRQPPKDPGN